MTRPPDLGAFWISLLCCAAACGAALTVFEERSYRRIVNLRAGELSAWDRLLWFGSIQARTLLALLPALIAALLLKLAGCDRCAWVLLYVTLPLLTAYLATDVRLQRITGNHLSAYAVYAFNVRAWAWAGDIGPIVWRMLGYATLATAGTVAALTITHVVVRLYGSDPAWMQGYAAAVIAGALYLTLIFAVVPARATVHNALALERLYNAFPAGLGLFSSERVPRRAATAFGVDADDRFVKALAPLRQVVTQPTPLDTAARLTRPDPPSVLIVILESFRDDMVRPDSTPRLCAWAERGMRWTRHHSASNNSYLGDYGLLYGRSPLGYDADIVAGRVLPPQLCATLKASGYTTSLLAGEGFENHHLDRFMSEGGFERAVIYRDGSWPERDRAVMRHIREALTQSTSPQLVVATLYSPHYGYNYPPAYGRRPTAMTGQRGVDRSHLAQADLRNRYLNCMSFIDTELGALLADLSTRPVIVAVTGDHGESFGEDGFRFHSSRLSQVQTRVPMLLGGPGIPARRIDALTTHLDLLPTLLHALEGGPVSVRGAHGRDLLAGADHDAALLVQPLHDSWELLLVRPEGKLSLNLRRRTFHVRVTGFADDLGRIDPALSRRPEDVEHWAWTLERVVAPMRRDGPGDD